MLHYRNILLTNKHYRQEVWWSFSGTLTSSLVDLEPIPFVGTHVSLVVPQN